MIWLVILAVPWLLVGHAGFKFWWEHDFCYADTALWIRRLSWVISLVGPLTWGYGALIHGRPRR